MQLDRRTIYPSPGRGRDRIGPSRVGPGGGQGLIGPGARREGKVALSYPALEVAG